MRQDNGCKPELGDAFGLFHVNMGRFLPFPTEEEEWYPPTRKTVGMLENIASMLIRTAPERRLARSRPRRSVIGHGMGVDTAFAWREKTRSATERTKQGPGNGPVCTPNAYVWT